MAKLEKVLELGTHEEVKNGKPLRYIIKTVPAELAEDAAEFMAKYFIPREPICVYYNFKDDPQAVGSFKDLWKTVVQSGTALMAVREGSEEERDRIIGVNMTVVSEKDDGHMGLKLEEETLFGKLTTYVMDISDRVNIFEKYGVEKFLTAVGLGVHSDYHGYRIGERILEARKPLSEALGIKVSATFFSNPKSQHIAEKVGFVAVVKEDYKDYRYKGKDVLKDVGAAFTYSVIQY